MAKISYDSGATYSDDFSRPEYYDMNYRLPQLGLAGQIVQKMFPDPFSSGSYDNYMKQLVSNASAPAAPMQPYLAAARPVAEAAIAPIVAATPPASMMPANNFNLAQFNSAPNAQQLALAPPKMVQPEGMAHGGEVDAALHAVRHHLAGGGFLSDLFSGPDYLSTGEVASPTNWGDPESAADFFKADRALRLAREVQAPMTSSVPDRAPLTAPRPGPVEVQELPVNIPFAAPDRGVSMLSSDISPASVTSLPLAYSPEAPAAPAAAAINQATGKLTARLPQEEEPSATNAQILAAIRANESRNKPTAQNPYSSAGGLYQFLNSTWGNTLRRMDPERFGAYSDRQLRGLKTSADTVDLQHAAANYHLANDIAPRLSKAGVPLTPGSAYLSWFQGPGGAVRAYTAPDNATVAQVFPKTVSANANMRFNGKPYAQWTMNDLRQWADTAMAKRMGRAHGGLVDDALHVVREHHADGEAVGPVEEPRPLTIYRGNAPVADEAGGSGREPAPAPPAFSYMPMPESVERQAARQPAYNSAERTWSDAGSTEGERLTRALGVEGELPKGETFMSAQPSGWDKYKPQRVPGTFLKRTGEAFNENADAVSEGLKAVRQGNYGAGALGMVGGGLGMAISPLTGMERVLVRDPYLRMTGNLKDAQAAEMAADVALTGGLRGMVKPFTKAGNLEKLAAEPVTSAYRMPSPGAAGAATAAGAMLAPDEAEASKLSKAMEVARMAIPRELSPLGFYSHGAEAARGLAQAKGTAQQFTSMLDKAGVRGPEMESYLQTFGGRPIVNKDEIAKHFQDTMPKLTERVNYDEGVTGPDWTTTGGGTRFGEHALSGGENYREVRMMLGSNRPPPLTSEEQSQLDNFRHLPYSQRTPEVVAQEADLVQRQRAYVAANLQNPDFTTSHWPGDPNVVAHLRMSDRTGPNGEKILHVEEIQSDWAQKARGLRDDEIMRVMKDKNLDWDEANKIVPSDFGFKPPADPMIQTKIDAAKKAAEEAGVRHQNLVEQITNSFGGAPDRKMPPGEYARAYDDYMKRRSDALKSHPEFEPSLQHFKQTNSELGSLREQQRAFANAEGVPTGPYVGKTPQWTDLALKRALKEAAEGGYDRVVFTPGAEQAKRWDLQHHVDNITWSAEPDGTYWVGATGKDGKPIPGLDNEPMTPRKLRETFGSDIAKKIMKGEGKPMVGGPELELSGLDLQTGEGMRSYYDKIVPKRLQELIKKHDPEARVGAHEIPNTGEKRRQGYADVGEIMNWHPSYTNLSRQEQSAQWNAMSPVNRRQLIKDYESAQSGDITGHGIDITPAMRESILRGQSAHARGGEVVDHALHAVRRHFAGDEGSYVDPMGSVAIPEAREPSDEPSLVDRAMNFVSQFNPVGSAEAAKLPKLPGTFKHPISGTKLVTPIEEMRPVFGAPTEAITPRRPMDWAATEGGVYMPATWDRSRGDRAILEEINGQKLTNPQRMEGGPLYMNWGDVQPEKQVAASGQSIVDRMIETSAEAKKLAGDKDVYLANVLMGLEGADFSHMVANPLVDLARQRGFSKSEAALVDDAIRKSIIQNLPSKAPMDKKVAYASAWPGIMHPDLDQLMWKMGGGYRSAIAKAMDTAAMKTLGVPDVASIRHAATQPELLNSPNLSTGFSVAKVDPGAPSVSSGHTTYPVGMKGLGYEGGSQVDIPFNLFWRDFMKTRPPGESMAHTQRAFTMQMPVQKADPQWVDTISNFERNALRGAIPLE